MIHVEPLRRVIDGVLSVAWALACATCDALLETPTQGVVCGKCWRDLPLITAPVCERCGGPRIDVAGRCSLRSLSSAGRHERRRRMPPRRRLLRGHVALGHSRVQVSRTALTCQTVGGPHAPGRRDLLDWADVVVPVPLHPRRRWERGFNQATELAAYLGPPVVSALRRTRTTPPQATLSARRRRLNVGGTFGGAPPDGGWRSTRVPTTGRTVVVVDDVMTTGATLEACAKTLQAAGAREVCGLTIARVDARPLQRSQAPRRSSLVHHRHATSLVAEPDGDSSL